MSANVAGKARWFAVPVFDRWLVHAPLHGVTALINRSGMDALRSKTPPSVGGGLRQLYAALTAPPTHHPAVKTGRFDPEYLAIITTRGCNISCTYCDFGGPTAPKVHMDPAIAIEAIESMAQHLVGNGRQQFLVHFFGGEPFISEELVETVVYHTKQVCAELGLRPAFDASTNGVFSEARADWIAEHFTSVVLSIDGPPEFQNRNRPARGGKPTFDIVSRNAERLGRSPIELCLRVCITGESVSRMAEMTGWMAERYRPAVINFEPLTENELTAGCSLKAADPYEFAVHWMAAKRVAERHGIRLVYSATEVDAPRLTSCPVGTDSIILSPDGQANACYLQPQDWLKHRMDMSLGAVRPGSGIQVDETSLRRTREVILDKPRCKTCLCQWSCAGGCHVSNTYRGSQESYTGFCEQTRLLAACLLLEEIGEVDLADRLLADPAAARALALHTSDVFDHD